MFRLSLRVLLFLTGLLVHRSAAVAHPLDLGFLSFNADGPELRMQLELHPVAAHTMNLDSSSATSAINVSFDNRSCIWRNSTQVLQVSPETIRFTAFADCATIASPFRVSIPDLRVLERGFNLIVKTKINGVERMKNLDPGSTSLEMNLEAAPKSFGTFAEMGLAHIGLASDEWFSEGKWHWPQGLDHIVFLIALIFAGDGFVTLLKMVTGFTLGHTISLALSVLNIVHLPGSIVEPAIALTIALVSFSAVLRINIRRKWVVTFLIGLIHGLAFAEALTSLHLEGLQLISAIFGFNIGVELAQALLITALYPMLLALRRIDYGDQRLCRACSAIISITGLYWMIERIFS